MYIVLILIKYFIMFNLFKTQMLFLQDCVLRMNMREISFYNSFQKEYTRWCIKYFKRVASRG